MLVFGPISSIFDFATFAVMLWVFDAGPAEFRSGWFVESLATQSLVVFAIRTRRVPFVRSRPSLPLTLTALGAAGIGALLPLTPLGHVLGFRALPMGFFATLAAMVVVYLVLIEFGKRLFYAHERAEVPPHAPKPGRHLRRRASYFSTASRDRSPGPGDATR
jgi:Mg2+-importing ATPase